MQKTTQKDTNLYNSYPQEEIKEKNFQNQREVMQKNSMFIPSLGGGNWFQVQAHLESRTVQHGYTMSLGGGNWFSGR